MNRSLLLLLLLALCATLPAHARAAEDDALMKACPGLAAWAADHSQGSETAADAGRQVGQPAMREELASRVATDARVRDAAIAKGPSDPAAMQAVMPVDADNLAWLKGVVARQGFPTVAQVGKQGVADAWLLVQHADRDNAFQQDVLRTLQARGEDAGVRKPDIAMLTDRVRLAQGKPQRYGTQFMLDASGALAMRPVEDASGLEARRAAVGLMPSALYRCVLGTSYGMPVAH